MKGRTVGVWTPFAFQAVISAIALVTYVATRMSNAWIPVFVCFLPMTFYFAAAAHQQTHERLRALEERVTQLESGKAGV